MLSENSTVLCGNFRGWGKLKAIPKFIPVIFSLKILTFPKISTQYSAFSRKI